MRKDRTIQITNLGIRTICEAESIIKPTAVGLKKIHILLLGITGRQSFDFLYTLFSVQPYSHYVVPLYERGTGLYIQLDIPMEVSLHIKTMLKELQSLEYFEECTFLDDYAISSKKMDFSWWVPDKKTWKSPLTNEAMLEIIENWNQKSAESKSKYSLRVDGTSSMQSLDKLDMFLLQELTINFNPNQIELGKYYKKSTATISRRLQKIRDNCIFSYQLYHDFRMFDLTWPLLIYGNFNGATFDIHALNAWIKENNIPFEIHGFMDQNDFILVTVLPPYFFEIVHQFFWNFCRNLKFFRIDLSRAKKFYFQAMNFSDNGSWKVSREYNVDIPVSLAEKMTQDDQGS